MDVESRLFMSFYKPIAAISEPHKIYVVQHIETNKIYVKKILDIYNKAVYEYLRIHTISNTPKIYEVYEENGKLTVIEEYISGDTLEQLIEKRTPFTNDKIRDIAVRLCLIVKELHSCVPSIIHRDIKPSNIIISPSGELFLLDFNAAKYHSYSKNEDTALLGTKGYAAPEQYGFGVSTPQTDIYAIGMLLKELTSCESYFEKKQKNEFSSIISKCTKLNSTDRYKNVSSILRILCKNEPAALENAKILPAWASYLPPGFQKLSPIYMFFSGAGYAFVFWLSFSLQAENSTPNASIVYRIFFLLTFLSIIFCSANYRNIQSYFPPCRTKNVILKIFAVILLDVLVFFAFIFIMIIVASVIK